MVALESRYGSTAELNSVETQMVKFGTMLGEWEAGESAPEMLAKYKDDLPDRIFAELNVLNALQ